MFYNSCFADNRLFFSVKTADGTAGTVRHKMGGITSCHYVWSMRQKDGFIYTTRYVYIPGQVFIIEKYDIALDTITLYSTPTTNAIGFEPTGEMRIALGSASNALQIAPIDLILVHRNVSASTTFTDIQRKLRIWLEETEQSLLNDKVQIIDLKAIDAKKKFYKNFYNIGFG